MDLKKQLKKNFGFGEFRKGQEKIVKAVLSGNDVFAMLPTGGGKSICYFLPAVISDGITCIISPLKSLIDDQVEKLSEFGIDCAIFTQEERLQKGKHIRLLRSNMSKIAIFTPESFINNFSLIADLNICRIVFDETHTVSEWGTTFRPKYLKCAEMVRENPYTKKAQKCAFTASATNRCMEDIILRIGMVNPLIFRTDFIRPNLILKHVNAEKISMDSIIKYIEQRRGKGLIYFNSRQSCEDMAILLQNKRIQADFFHAEMRTTERKDKLYKFKNGDIRWMCCTIAFGMGVDIDDISNVIHFDTPTSMEAYYQGIGRGGRNGCTCHCLAQFSFKQLARLKSTDQGLSMANTLRKLYLTSEGKKWDFINEFFKRTENTCTLQ